MMDLRSAARALGGNVIGPNAIAAPGPGHGPNDRSLTVKFISAASDGFVVYTHSARDNWREARDHVRAKLGLPAWQPNGAHAKEAARLERVIVNIESA